MVDNGSTTTLTVQLPHWTHNLQDIITLLCFFLQEGDDPDHHGEGYGVCIATVFNIAAIAGTGILVLPNALANTGVKRWHISYDIVISGYE